MKVTSQHPLQCPKPKDITISLLSPPPTPPERNEVQTPEETTAEQWTQQTESNHSETETSSDSAPDSRPHSPQTCSVGVAKSGSTTSIYLDNGTSEDPKPSRPPQPQKRLTMVRSSSSSTYFVNFTRQKCERELLKCDYCKCAHMVSTA